AKSSVKSETIDAGKTIQELFLAPRPVSVAPTLPKAPATFGVLTAWAATADPQYAADLALVLGAAEKFSIPAEHVNRLKSSEFLHGAAENVVAAESAVTVAKKQMNIQPVGLLHLERMTFAPDGIERGELVYS